MNDIEKAIEYLRDRKYLQITDWKVKSYDLAISALEKQMPKQVNEITIIQQYKAVLDGYCPSCQRYLTNSMQYCPDCSQKLDWEEEDED